MQNIWVIALREFRQKITNRGFLISTIATPVILLVVFAFSRGANNTSIYDPYWSVAPIAMALYWWLAIGIDTAGIHPVRALCVVALVTLWGVRLTTNWARGWQGLDHEDFRYADFRHKAGRAYWLVSLLGLHGFPTVQVLLSCGSVYVALAVGTRPFGWLDLVAVGVTAFAVLYETVADQQLRRFKATNDDPQGFIATGLWAWSRHPNYFGEVLFWWGLLLFALAADPGAPWTLIGPVTMTLMFWFISIPLIDERMVKRRPHYAQHQARVSRLVPWPPQRAAQRPEAARVSSPGS